MISVVTKVGETSAVGKDELQPITPKQKISVAATQKILTM
jgi:hypothetical protein